MYNNMNILEKLNQIAKVDTSWQDDVIFREENEYWLQQSGYITIKILTYLRKNNLTKFDLITILDIDEETCIRIVKGDYNFDLALIMRIQNNLNIQIITM